MSTPDLLIHVHTNLSAEGRTTVENDVKTCNGVISANFDHHQKPHSLIVLYNPDVISGNQILASVKKYDPAASMVGL